MWNRETAEESNDRTVTLKRDRNIWELAHHTKLKKEKRILERINNSIWGVKKGILI